MKNFVQETKREKEDETREKGGIKAKVKTFCDISSKPFKRSTGYLLVIF